MNAFTEAFLYEIKSIKDSWYLLSLITVLPIVSFFLIIAIFYGGVPRDMPIAVVDNDNSKISRELLKNIDSSSSLKIISTCSSTKEALNLLKRAEVYGVVIVPKDFSKNSMLQIQPKVTAMINTQYILIGKIITSALSSTVMQSSAQIEYMKSLVSLQNSQATIDSIAPIGMGITPFFNLYQNYFLFLVTAVLPSMWQIFIVIATIVSFGTMFKAGKEKEFYKDNHIVLRTIGKLLPYTIAYMLLGSFSLFYIYGTLSWVFQGSFAVTIFAMFLTTVAYQAMALLFIVFGFDYAKALSLGAVYTAPAFAFLGITYPVFNMNPVALLWRDILPISHYMEIQLSQANYGVSLYMEVDKLVIIFVFWIVFVPVFLLLKKRLNR